MYITLKKKYNKLVKWPSGINGISRKKKTLCKWSLIRHDKLLYTSNFEFLWDCIVGNEYNLDHKFSPFANKADKIVVDTFFEYFKHNSNPFDFSNDKSTNFVTGEFIDPEPTENLIHITTMGEGVCSEFKSSQLDKKIVRMFDSITKTKVVMKSAEL